MSTRFEATNAEAANEAVVRFNRFHDDYVAGIEIKFENYKPLDEEGASTGIGDADKTIILMVNTYPYGKDHEQRVSVQFKGVQSFEISSLPEGGPMWGIFTTLVSTADEHYIEWKFDFICSGSRFSVTCSEIVIIGQPFRQG